MWRRVLESAQLALACILLNLAFPQVASGQALTAVSEPTLNTDRDPMLGACFGRVIKTVYTPIEGGSFDIKVKDTTVSVAAFPEWVQFDYAAFSHDGFKIVANTNVVTVAPNGAAVGTTANVVLLAGDLSINMNLTMSDSEHTGVIRVMLVPHEEYERRQREARHVRDDPVLRNERLREAADFLLDLKVLHGRGGQLSLNHPGQPFALTIAQPGEIRAAYEWAAELDGHLYGIVTVENRRGHPVKVVGAAVAQRDRSAGVSASIVWERSATVESDTLQLDDAQTVRGVVEIPESLDGPLDSVEVHLLGIGGLTVASTEIIELYPVPDDVRRRRRMARQITISVRGLFGGFWTGDAAGQDRTAGAAMAGVGVRVQKGMHQNFAFEAEFVAGRSGEVSFSDIPWSGTVGDVTRRASFGRFQGLGVIRFGTEFVASMRAGLGMQVAGYESAFVTGGSPTAGPGDGFEVDGFLALGAAVDARLGEHWTIGVGMGFSKLFSSSTRSFEGALHIGYSIDTKRSYF